MGVFSSTWPNYPLFRSVHIIEHWNTLLIYRLSFIKQKCKTCWFQLLKVTTSCFYIIANWTYLGFGLLLRQQTRYLITSTWAMETLNGHFPLISDILYTATKIYKLSFNQWLQSNIFIMSLCNCCFRKQSHFYKNTLHTGWPSYRSLCGAHKLGVSSMWTVGLWYRIGGRWDCAL